ncbi:unnamed protein product [Rotaria sp. Silwood1]|nr:unnamed protein product [Rotaria sp. Silwood1]
MNEEIQTFVEFLLDTETTSETLFSKAITEKHDLYNNVRNGSIFEKVVDQKLQQWKRYYQKEQGAIADRIAINAGNETSDDESESESEEESSSDNEDEKISQLQIHGKSQTFQLIKQSDVLIDPVSQCKRLLEFLYYCQQDHIHLTKLYFRTLDHCIKNENEKISSIALQQIALHLLDNIHDEKDYHHLMKCFQSNLSSSTIPETHKPIVKMIQTLISRNKSEQDIITVMSSNDLDILYPYKARFLDLHREFRDSANYFIDGDSLILFVAHHINIDLLTYYGNTLHVIYRIERILLTLFNQTQQCNYTLVFFNCHYQLYHNEKSILCLIRACLITHLLKNINKYGSSKVRQFSSWLDKEYIKFAYEEKPHFIFYHDMTSFDICKNTLLSKNTLIKLLYIYRLFGNYHQYYFQCSLYLMNKLILTDTIVKCFRVVFMKQCSMNLLEKRVRKLSPDRNSSTILDQNDSIEFGRRIYDITNQDDVRLFIYLKTIMNFTQNKKEQSNKQNLFNLLSPLLILHVALLIRLSLIDRHLPSNFPSITFIQQLIQSKHIIVTSSTLDKQLIPFEKQKITKISNSFIDIYLKPILSAKNQWTFDFVTPDNTSLARYEGKYHWHVYKEVGDEISRVRDNQEKYKNYTKYRYRTKNVQKFYTYFTLYGKSLTSRDVIDNQLKIVLPATQINEEMNNIDKADSASGDKKHKEKSQSEKFHQTKRDKIIEENKQRKIDKCIIDETDQLIHVKDSLKQIPFDNYSEAIEIIDGSLFKCKISKNRLELLKKKFHLQRKYLKTLRKKNNLTNEEKSKLDYLEIDYFATMTEIGYLENTIDLFGEKQKYMKELIDNSLLDQEKWYRFQMERINSRLPRREHGIPDSRVSDFIPDNWQRQFLDAVDKQQSIIIVAPTASGKTYASYYAMNKVLKDRDNPNGICVYIAPTKALVNQVAATIHNKFGPVYGIFTRDYRSNIDGCRILVTIPQCMQILLLSPRQQRWCQRIKYAIFDEIHCMSGDIESDVWEKSMLLINCPMIGLSTTVNNVDEVCRWIENVENQRSKLFQTSKPRRVCFIAYHERIADLNKYLYSNRQLHPIHPIGLMNTKQLITRGVPKDFSLSPYETLQLNDAMNTLSVNRIENQIDSKPVPVLTQYFSPDWIIERNKCNDYSRLVCNQFNSLIKNKETLIIDSITTSLKPITSKDIYYPESKPISLLIVDFILTLKEKDLLPCIVFSDNRLLCENMATHIAEYFENLERDLRETKYKNQIELLNKRLKTVEKTQKKIKSKKISKSSKQRNYDDNNIVESETLEEDKNHPVILSGLEQQLLNGILDEGTLANRHGCNRELVDSLLERASRENPLLVGYIQRGVAYHHAGLNNKGRAAVEALFRNRYIQVVFSTATLAFGIHMPTKTVAFVNDSIYLDALQYRQSSGRAGRRGFDVQGHVVFIDIPLSKISHLIISAIPNIRAHFPTSVTFFMRLLHLCSNSKDSNDAINRSLIALQCPLLAQSFMKHQLIDIQTRFHSLFTLDFLYRLNLINQHGDLIGLAGLLTHLHYFEPANILLVYLMYTKYFDSVKDEIEIMTIFAYLFTNMPWLLTRHEYNDLSEYRRESKFNSKLFLPPISKEFRKHIDKYNSIVKDVYGCYIENVTKYLRSLNNKQEEEILPFSNISFAQTKDYDNGTFEYNLHYHQSQQIQNPSISPFAGLSGLTHENLMLNYNSIVSSWDLVYHLDLSPKIIPFIDIDCRDHTNTTYHLNSYGLDFFKQGSEASLINENELSPGDTYSLLSDLHFVLLCVKESLEIIIKNEDKQPTTKDIAIFNSLYESLSHPNVSQIDQSLTPIKKLSLILPDEAQEIQQVKFCRLPNIVYENFLSPYDVLLSVILRWLGAHVEDDVKFAEFQQILRFPSNLLNIERGATTFGEANLAPMKLTKEGLCSLDEIHLGSHTNLGNRCIIMPAIRLPPKVIVGSLTLVTRKTASTENNCILLGIPAHQIPFVTSDNTSIAHIFERRMLKLASITVNHSSVLMSNTLVLSGSTLQGHNRILPWTLVMKEDQLSPNTN